MTEGAKESSQSLYKRGDVEREDSASNKGEKEPYRSDFRRDAARLIHCAAFRRLQGKTQVFPGGNSDFFRNRLTHSLEVAQIAKSLAIRINAQHEPFASPDLKINPDLVELAALAHDLGHPPFGHNGEEALDEAMSDYGGFEGNAQTLHILARTEKKQLLAPADKELHDIVNASGDRRIGLNFTYRSLASILKYDAEIPERKDDRDDQGVQKGFYTSHARLVKRIKQKVLGVSGYHGKFKTIECSIMDIADDIAYSTYDMEDCFKSGHLHPLKMIILNDSIYEAAANTINKRLRKQYADYEFVEHKMTPELVKAQLITLLREVFEISKFEQEMLEKGEISWDDTKRRLAFNAAEMSYTTAEDGYYRTEVTSALIQQFLDGVEIILNDEFPQLHNARLAIETFKAVESLKNVVFESVIRSPEMQTFEYRGKDIVRKIFDAVAAPTGDKLLPRDFRKLCENVSGSQRKRIICDFVAGMTDRYAWEFYNRIAGTSPHSLYTPV